MFITSVFFFTALCGFWLITLRTTWYLVKFENLLCFTGCYGFCVSNPTICKTYYWKLQLSWRNLLWRSIILLDLNQSSVHQCRKVANWFANHIGSLVLSAVVHRLPVSIKG